MLAVTSFLFWIGTHPTVAALALLAHGLAIWHWRGRPWTSALAITWLLVFIAISVGLYPGVQEAATRGSGYVEAHLYSGRWRPEDEAVTKILRRWQNVWLPIYIPWLGTWLIGLAAIVGFSKVEGRFRLSSPLGSGVMRIDT